MSTLGQTSEDFYVNSSVNMMWSWNQTDRTELITSPTYISTKISKETKNQKNQLAKLWLLSSACDEQYTAFYQFCDIKHLMTETWVLT